MNDISVDVDDVRRDTLTSSVFSYQKQGGGRYSAGRRYPKPYPAGKFTWDPNRAVGNIASVIARDITSGPERTLSPQRHRPSKISIYTDVAPRGVNEIWKPSPRIVISPSPKARRDSLRDLPYMAQNLLRNRPLLQQLKMRLNRSRR